MIVIEKASGLPHGLTLNLSGGSPRLLRALPVASAWSEPMRGLTVWQPSRDLKRPLDHARGRAEGRSG